MAEGKKSCIAQEEVEAEGGDCEDQTVLKQRYLVRRDKERKKNQHDGNRNGAK